MRATMMWTCSPGPLLFSTWAFEGCFPFLLSCLITASLPVLRRALQNVIDGKMANMADSWLTMVRPSPKAFLLPQKGTAVRAAAAAQPELLPQPGVDGVAKVQLLLLSAAVHTLSLMTMLIAMTFNWGLFFSIVAGEVAAGALYGGGGAMDAHGMPDTPTTARFEMV